MRTDIIRLQAKQLQAGMTLAYHNSRMDWVLGFVNRDKHGIKVENQDQTRTEFLKPSDYVFIKRGI
jgi:hypothetical protein